MLALHLGWCQHQTDSSSMTKGKRIDVYSSFLATLPKVKDNQFMYQTFKTASLVEH